MNVIVCGLNSYLGNASLKYLPNDNFNVYGIVRDQEIVLNKLIIKTKAKLFNLDLIRDNTRLMNIQLPPCGVSFYFTQTPELNDIVGANYELLSIRNFIAFSKSQNCNRIVYVGTIYDRKHLKAIENLFIEYNIVYTIVLKDVAIGEETSFEEFMNKMLKNRFIFIYKPTKNIIFNPIRMMDLMQWLRQVNWDTTYLNQFVQYSGKQTIELEKIMELYQKKYSHQIKYRHIPLKNRHMAKVLNKYFSGIPYDQYIAYINEITDRSDIKDISFVKQTSTNHTDLIELI